jgi:hypothetical protein
VRDAFGDPKTGYAARAFQQGFLVSSNGTTSASANSPGTFVLSLPAGTSAGIALELAPENSAPEPWITFNEPLSLTQPNTDLGVIALPGYLVANMLRLPARGNDAIRTPVADARVRAYTKLDGGDARVSTIYVRDGITDAMGGANLQLVPGPTGVPLKYTVSVVPSPGAPWASRCVDDVLVEWTGQAQASPLAEVPLVPRPVVSGVVLSATGAPITDLVINATRTPTPAPPCLPSPTTTSVTTSATGRYELPLDPGTYQLDYIPTPGSAIPRLTVPDVMVESDLARPVVMPAPALIEGDLRQDDTNAPLPYTTIRFFEPQCRTTAACTQPPLLRAETQSNADGHFRAIIAAPPGTY